MVKKTQIIQIQTSADTVYALKDYTSATILYFKTWFAIQDHILLEKMGRAPKDHSERFRLLEKEFTTTYVKLDREFSTYRDTYSKVIDKQTCDRIRKIVKNEIQTYNLT